MVSLGWFSLSDILELGSEVEKMKKNANASSPVDTAKALNIKYLFDSFSVSFPLVKTYTLVLFLLVTFGTSHVTFRWRFP